jgi:hypothetical protein
MKLLLIILSLIVITTTHLQISYKFFVTSRTRSKKMQINLSITLICIQMSRKRVYENGKSITINVIAKFRINQKLPRQKISVEKLEYLRKYPPPDENEL